MAPSKVRLLAFISLFLCWAFGHESWAQCTKVQIVDSSSQIGVSNARVLYLNENIVSDDLGFFSFRDCKYPMVVRITAFGFNPRDLTIIDQTINKIYLIPIANQTQEVVITGSGTAVDLSRETQSMSLIKPSLISAVGATQPQDLLVRSSGIQVQKNQVTIRGISGFNYGAGSRVSLLLDGMPLTSADAGDIKWSYLPIENVGSIEVLKGAGSVLYGSGASEGVIHIRSAKAGIEPFLALRFQTLAFGDYNPPFGSPKKKVTFQNITSAAYRVKTKEGLGIVTSMAGVVDRGFRGGDSTRYARAHLRLDYTNPNQKWTFEGAGNIQRLEGGNYLLFGDALNPYQGLAGTNSKESVARGNLDLTISHNPSKRSSYWNRFRYFNTTNTNTNNGSSRAQNLYQEVGGLRRFPINDSMGVNLLAGIVNVPGWVNSGPLYGNRQSYTVGAFTQAEFITQRLRVIAGIRVDRFYMPEYQPKVYPLLRTGLSYKVSKSNTLRLSAGQGIRYPSIAERFATAQGGSLRIFNNPNLVAEQGGTAEVGVRQLFNSKIFLGFVDLSLFGSKYRNMIEYVFGFYPPPNYNPADAFKYIGFAAQNIAKTQVYGLELSTGTNIEVRDNLSFNLWGGYTYIVPTNVLFNPSTDPIDRNKYLKYRRKEIVRANLQIDSRRTSVSFFNAWNSSYLNIDEFFLDAVSNLRLNDNWKTLSKAYLLDMSISQTFSPYVKLTLLGKNLTNATYMEVPGNYLAPRSIGLSINYTLGS